MLVIYTLKVYIVERGRLFISAWCLAIPSTDKLRFPRFCRFIDLPQKGI